jgi:hypothetical protein
MLAISRMRAFAFAWPADLRYGNLLFRAGSLKTEFLAGSV